METTPATFQPMLFSLSEGESLMLASSQRFRESSELERAFALAWLEALANHPAARPDVVAVGAKAGVGKTKAYELMREPRVLHLIREASQAHGDLADVAGAMAHDLLRKDALARVRDGRLNRVRDAVDLMERAAPVLSSRSLLSLGTQHLQTDGKREICAQFCGISSRQGTEQPREWRNWQGGNLRRRAVGGQAGREYVPGLGRVERYSSREGGARGFCAFGNPFTVVRLASTPRPEFSGIFGGVWRSVTANQAEALHGEHAHRQVMARSKKRARPGRGSRETSDVSLQAGPACWSCQLTDQRTIPVKHNSTRQPSPVPSLAEPLALSSNEPGVLRDLSVPRCHTRRAHLVPAMQTAAPTSTGNARAMLRRTQP